MCRKEKARSKGQTGEMTRRGAPVSVSVQSKCAAGRCVECAGLSGEEWLSDEG